MTIGEIAAIISAVAFAVLVIFLCLNLMKTLGILKDLNETVKRLNSTVDVVTKDVDNLSIEVEGLLNKANTLVDDVNGKLGKTDPLFTAIGDLGVTVSDVNDSTKEMTANLVSGISAKKKSSPIEKFIKATKKIADSKPSKLPKIKEEQDEEVEVVPVSHPVVEEPTAPITQDYSNLVSEEPVDYLDETEKQELPLN
ncbi:DUF948 domain-containing protein [Vaginisenegalia massiliensis]|uniref:DUF948 domain-containing protein n=1 Tax=Vaginisenegalia massiliensis TaxID=2058294 RepID=UPI000F54395E|nr:DUF948 domain-containing protein [Vaginisenegalia massiliensis]